MVLEEAKRRQAALGETPAQFATAGGGRWPITNPGFERNGLAGDFAASLENNGDETRYAGEAIAKWMKLYNTGPFGMNTAGGTDPMATGGMA